MGKIKYINLGNPNVFSELIPNPRYTISSQNPAFIDKKIQAKSSPFECNAGDKEFKTE